MMSKKNAFASGLILIGVAIGLWVGRIHNTNVDLGAAPSQYVPAGTLRLVDATGVEIFTIGLDPTSPLDTPLHIQLHNGADSDFGWFGVVNGSEILSLIGPPVQGISNPREVTVDESFGQLTVRTSITSGSPQVYIPIPPAYKPRPFSWEWWWNLVFSDIDKWRATIQTEVPSEDARLVTRDGKLVAVCGRDKAGTPAMLFVDPDRKPQAQIGFNRLEGQLSSPSFGLFNRDGFTVAVLETDSSKGPRLSVASEDRLSRTGLGLFTLDPTGTKLAGDIARPGPSDGIVDWMAQPTYRAKLPIRLIDGAGKVLWSTASLPK